MISTKFFFLFFLVIEVIDESIISIKFFSTFLVIEVIDESMISIKFFRYNFYQGETFSTTTTRAQLCPNPLKIRR